MFNLSDASNTCQCNKDLLRNRKNILLRYIDGSKELELHAVYALQQLVTDLNHPRGLSIFNSYFLVLHSCTMNAKYFLCWLDDQRSK